MTIETDCPYCGEPLTLEVDEYGGRRQSYVEDCAVCCRPIEVRCPSTASRRTWWRAGRTNDAGGGSRVSCAAAITLQPASFWPAHSGEWGNGAGP